MQAAPHHCALNLSGCTLRHKHQLTLDRGRTCCCGNALLAAEAHSSRECPCLWLASPAAESARPTIAGAVSAAAAQSSGLPTACQPSRRTSPRGTCRSVSPDSSGQSTSCPVPRTPSALRFACKGKEGCAWGRPPVTDVGADAPPAAEGGASRNSCCLLAAAAMFCVVVWIHTMQGNQCDRHHQAGCKLNIPATSYGYHPHTCQHCPSLSLGCSAPSTNTPNAHSAMPPTCCCRQSLTLRHESPSWGSQVF